MVKMSRVSNINNNKIMSDGRDSLGSGGWFIWDSDVWSSNPLRNPSASVTKIGVSIIIIIPTPTTIPIPIPTAPTQTDLTIKKIFSENFSNRN